MMVAWAVMECLSPAVRNGMKPQGPCRRIDQLVSARQIHLKPGVGLSICDSIWRRQTIRRARHTLVDTLANSVGKTGLKSK